MEGGLGGVGLLQDKVANLNFKYIWGEVVLNKMSADRAGWAVYGSVTYPTLKLSTLFTMQVIFSARNIAIYKFYLAKTVNKQ